MDLIKIAKCPQKDLKNGTDPGQWYEAYKEGNLIGYVFVEIPKTRNRFARKPSLLSRTTPYFDVSGNGEFAETSTAYPHSALIRELVIALTVIQP